MKKNYFFLMLLFTVLLGVAPAKAELVLTTVGDGLTSVAALQDQKTYLLKSVGVSDNGNYANDVVGANIQLLSLPEMGVHGSANFVWVYEKVSETTGKFKNLATGKYIPVLSRGANITSSANAETFTITHTQEGKFEIKGGNGQWLNTNITAITGWNGQGANSLYRIIPATTEEVATYTITHTEKVGEKVVRTNVKTYSALEKPTIPAPTTYFASTLSSYTMDGTAISGAKTIDNLTQNHEFVATYTINNELLPFKVSTTDEKHYYGLTLRGKSLYYTASDNRIPGSTTLTATQKIADNALWYITGNPVSGFKLYNKSTGDAKIAYSHGARDNIQFGMELLDIVYDDADYLLEKTDDHYYFRKNGFANGYLNDISSKLGFWVNTNAATDAGSRFIFTTEESLFAAAKELVQTQLTRYASHKNVIGGISATDYTALEQQLGTLKTAADIENFAVSITSKVIKPVPGKVYTIKADARDGMYFLTTNGTVGNLSATKTASNDDTQKWICGMNAEGNYVFVNKKSGAYLDGRTTVANLTNKQWIINPTNTNNVPGLSLFMHRFDDAKSKYLVVRRDNGALDRGTTVFNKETTNFSSDFIFEEVGEETVTLTASTDGKSYASFVAPYAVEIPTGIFADIAVLQAGNKVSFESISGSTVIPAATPVVLRSNTASTAPVILAPATTAGDVTTDNLLKYSATATTATSAMGTCYRLYKNNAGEVLFGQMNENAPIPAYKVYLQFPAATNAPLAISFDGLTTGIEAAPVAAKIAGTYYDLNGRAVAQPTNGIYILHGKKVIIK